MPQQTKTFRVFISSTFTDMKAERNLLFTKVFPELERFCLERGAKFQAIDLRWGVTEEAQRNQKTLDICLSEIHRCQRLSPRPNFIIFLGDRYGWQPIPAKIPSGDMAQVKASCNHDEATFIDDWYRLDENAILPEYVLLGWGEKIKTYQEWETVEIRLGRIIRSAIDASNFSAIESLKYKASATHFEILEGILNPPQGVNKAEEHVLAFSRNIRNLPQTRDAKIFIDWNSEKNIPCRDSAQKLTTLKTELAEKLGNGFIEYSAQWNGDSSISIDNPNEIIETVIKHFQQIIENELKQVVNPDVIVAEQHYHESFCKRLTNHFRGRKKTLDEIQSYITSNSTNPFALIGSSGSGKSSVIAKAIEQVRERMPEALIIYRFIGANAGSTNIFSLLQSLSTQIAVTFGVEVSSLLDEKKRDKMFERQNLTELFKKCLDLATSEKPVLVFLDALDQLSDADSIQTITWIPKEISAYTSVVVSGLPELENSLAHTKIVHLEALPPMEAKMILDHWLIDAKRKLQKKQYEYIIMQFTNTGLPLYLRIAFEQARNWRSFDQLIFLPDTVEEAIELFFANLEREHTRELISTAISYMLCGKDSGLTEDEILSLLYLDQEYWTFFLNSSNESHRSELKQAERMPVVVWSRLFFDIEQFLSERDSYGEQIVVFYHQLFNEIANAKYNTEAKKIHERLSIYYEKCPLFLDEDESKRPNVRKLTEQAWQEMQAEKWEYNTKTLSSLFFIEAKIKASMIGTLYSDYIEVIKVIPVEKNKITLETIYHALNLETSRMLMHPNYTFQWLYNQLQWNEDEISNDLKKEYDIYINTGGSLLQQCKKPYKIKSRLIKEFIAEYDPIRDHFDKPISCALSPDMKLIIAGQSDGFINVFDVISGTIIESLRAHDDFYYKPGYSPRVTSVVFSEDGSIFITGDSFGYISYWNSSTLELLEKRRLGGVTDGGVYAISASCKYAVVVKTYDRYNRIKVYNLASNKVILSSIHVDQIANCSFSQDDKFLISVDYIGTTKLWTLNKLDIFKSQIRNKKKQVLKIKQFGKHSVSAFSPNDGFVAFGFENGIIKLYDSIRMEAIVQIEGHNAGVTSLNFSFDGKYIISGSEDHFLKLWDLTKEWEQNSLKVYESPINVCLFSNKNDTVYMCSKSGDVKLFDTRHFESIEKRNCEDYREVKSADICPEGDLIALTGESFGEICIISQDSYINPMKKRIHDGAGTSIKFSPDGSKLLSAGKARFQDSYEVLIIDLVTFEIATVVNMPWQILDCGFSPDNKLIVTADALLASVTDISSLSEHDKIIKRFNHSKAVTSSIFTNDGRRLITTSEDKTINLWELRTESHVASFKGHNSWVLKCALSSDNQTLITGSYDGTLILWDVEKSQEIGRYILEGGFGSISYSSDGISIACGDNLGNYYHLKKIGYKIDRPIITAKRFWKSRIIEYANQVASYNKENKGYWDEYISYICPHCFNKCPINNSLLDTIQSINKDNHIENIDSPCLKLPEEAWDEPYLLSECQSCAGLLKFNPFLVDNKDHYCPK